MSEWCPLRRASPADFSASTIASPCSGPGAAISAIFSLRLASPAAVPGPVPAAIPAPGGAAMLGPLCPVLGALQASGSYISAAVCCLFPLCAVRLVGRFHCALSISTECCQFPLHAVSSPAYLAFHGRWLLLWHDRYVLTQPKGNKCHCNVASQRHANMCQIRINCVPIID